MRKDLGIEGLGDLVELPIVATLATYRRDGTVLLSPVWHEWRDGGFTVCVNGDDVKAKHVRRDPRASIALYESEPPYRGVELRTHASITTEDIAETWMRIAVRYLGQEVGAAYAADMSGIEVLLRLVPGELRTWDFADDAWS
jgi:PPOX class probable F420-dependent enzyme